MKTLKRFEVRNVGDSICPFSVWDNDKQTWLGDYATHETATTRVIELYDKWLNEIRATRQQRQGRAS